MKISIKNFMAGVLILMLSASAMAGQGKTQRVEVLDKLVSIEMPESFKATKIPESDIKSSTYKLPPEAYTHVKNAANFVFNYTTRKVADNQLDAFAEKMNQMLAKHSPKVSKLEINGQQAQLIDYVAPAADGVNVHTLILAMSVNGNLLMVTFNTPEVQASTFLAVGREALLSIKVNKK
ncbi:hypothetical protein [Buttiauxella gaviniae]|uniref:hypothetical protein n=1 Tax=Buttiauxella gaviniae TaxID=82990 RepID=UPI003BB4D047